MEITIELILKAIADNHGTTKRVLLDGFPRNSNNLDGWFRMAHDEVKTLGVLFFEVNDEEELVRRILERGKTSGRADDNEEVLKKRFATMNTQTVPVVQRLEQDLVVKRVNAMDSIDNVWLEVDKALKTWWN